MKYNTALDFMAIALQQAKAGNHEVAAKCLLQASRESDSDKALQIIEHSNGIAAKALIAAATKAKTAKSAKAAVAVKAEAEDVDFDESILDEDLQGDGGEDADVDLGEEVDAAADDEVDVGGDDAFPAGDDVVEEDSTEAMAAVMASFFAQAAKQVQATKKVKRK